MTHLNAQPVGLRLPDSFGLDADAEQGFRDAAWQLIVKGISDPDELAEYAADDLDLTDEAAREAAEFLVAARKQQQAGFGAHPDLALHRAFADLESERVLARQDWTCCGTCGAAEIGDDVDDLSQWLGYVFFHTQDTDQLIDVGSTYLSYGLFWAAHMTEAEFEALSEQQRADYYERETIALMQRVVVPTFERHGITVEWDGSLDQRILIGGVAWYAPLT